MWLKKCYMYVPARYLKKNIKDVIKNHPVINQWAYVYHEQESKYDFLSDHYHIYLEFGDKKINTEWIASWFNIPEYLILDCVFGRGTIIDIFSHSLSTLKYKRKYKLDKIKNNFKDFSR